MIRGGVKRIWVLQALKNPYIADEIKSSKIPWSEIIYLGYKSAGAESDELWRLNFSALNTDWK